MGVTEPTGRGQGWGVDRRIGRRTAVRGVGVTWTVPGEKAGLLRRAPRVYKGELADISVTGASMVARRSDRVDRGTTILLRIGEAETVAVVRHVNELADEGTAVHGLAFGRMNETMERLLARLGGAPGGGYSTSWNRGPFPGD